jgi:hypothetical protein
VTKDGSRPRPRSSAADDDDLPYAVELWNDQRRLVENHLAMSRNAGVAYAAFYAATRLFPDRYITLRLNGRVLSRFNGQ